MKQIFGKAAIGIAGLMLLCSGCETTKKANNAQKGGVTGGVIGNKMDKQATVIKSEIPGAEVTRVAEGINVTFNEKNPDGSKAGVYFGTALYDINANSKLALDKLVKVFKDYPETNILVEGHTDDVGTSTYNETLSKNRA